MIRNTGIVEQVRLWDGCISYWKLDETSGTTTVDSIGGVNGVCSNAALFTGGFSGINNNCANFSGGSYNIDFGNADVLNIKTSAFSVSFWAYGKIPYTPASQTIIAKSNGGGASTSYGWLILSINSIGGTAVEGVSFVMSTSSTHFLGGIPNTNVPDNQWNHYCFTLSSTRSANTALKGYLNGQEISLTYYGNASSNTGSITNTVNLKFGSESDNAIYFFKQLDEVAIWNRALSATEAKMLYSQGNGKFYGTKTDLDYGMTAYFRFDEVSGTTAIDSRRGNNGTFTDADIRTADGKNNRGLELAAAGSNRVITVNNRLGISNPPVTISHWMKEGANYVITDVCSLWQFGSNSLSNFGYMSYYFNGYYYTQIGNGGGGAGGRYSYVFNNARSAISGGTWHHIVCTMSAWNNQKLYIDGQEWTNVTNSGTATSINWGTDLFRLFAYLTNSPTANIYFDEFACWNRVLTLQEIQTLYSEGRGNFY